jgi:aldehyde:ferredoxin oxidoreductase
MDGLMGKILRVDLTQGSHKVEDLDPRLATDYIGGRGLAVKFLYDGIDPKVDALDPANKLIFAAGPLTGTRASCSSRWVVVGKSPLGTLGCANGGGFFGPELKYAGYDMIIVEGKAAEPVYLSIKDDKVELKSAKALWGKGVHETEDLIRAETGDKKTRVAAIGPAGEKLAKVAAVITEKHNAAGRGGLGAVMGSKNLKAVAVRGSKSIPIADPEGFKEACKKVLEKVKANPVSAQSFPANGSAGILHIYNEVGMLPTRNHQSGVFEGAHHTGGDVIAEKYLIKNRACYGCSMACGGATEVKDSPFAGTAERPEYETAWAFGAQCGNDNPEAILKANDLCNDLGLDTISVGSTIACAMEMSEKGYLPESDVGFPLKFGDAEAMVKLVEMTGNRTGLGDVIAEGGHHLASKYGHPELHMGVKKLECPAYDPRVCQGQGLNLATAARGACHNKGYTMLSEILADAVKVLPKTDPFATEGKAQLTKDIQDATVIFDNTGVCLFQLVAIWKDELLDQLVPCTGEKYTMESLLEVGERTWNLERLFILKAGLTAKDDALPKRLLEEPMPEGPGKGRVNRLHEMLPEYYSLRGWDENGVPTEKKLKALGLA